MKGSQDETSIFDLMREKLYAAVISDILDEMDRGINSVENIEEHGSKDLARVLWCSENSNGFFPSQLLFVRGNPKRKHIYFD